MKKTKLVCLLFTAMLLLSTNLATAQGVTTGAISGLVLGADGTTLPGATILAVHEPSGTRYGTITLADGRFGILGMRVGGPYVVTVSYVGFETQQLADVYITLGGTSNMQFTLRDAAMILEGVEILHVRDDVFSSGRTGASTSIGTETISRMPSISRRINDFTRLTPQSRGNAFAGTDNRLNNLTIDGSYFNNAFGLGGQPGDRTGVAPISLSAIEAITVNIAPYDVRQGNFVGAGINVVTKSGTNQIRGEAFYNFRNSNMSGVQARHLTFTPTDFSFDEFGVSVGGPIIRDRLFFFADFSREKLVSPGTTFLANTGGQTVGGNITRVLASDLTQLSTFLYDNFGYETGPFQGYSHETPATRFIAKLDYNLNDRNKISIRYNQLESIADIILSNSASLGMGARRTNTTALNFQNSNYQIVENITSLVGEWHSRIGDNMSNNLIAGYTFHDESRRSRGEMFPFVDILKEGSTYTSFGFEPFTPNNELRYSTLQLQNNFTIFRDAQTWTFGVSLERYESENIFFPGSQSVYTYNSLEDFYADANQFLNPDPNFVPISLRRFQVRWSNIPGQDRPIQPLEVFSAGIYGQNEWQVTPNLNLTFGLRADVPFFGETALRNEEVETLSFRDENNDTVTYRTDKLPDPRPLWSPRFGFNWDVHGDRSMQVRGGTGIFTGRPPYVWISNQIGNNGMMTGFLQEDNTTNFPFNPNPHHYKPAEVTGEPASSYELALTDPNFKFPQVWRTNIAVDQRLPFGLIGTLELLYSRDVNGVYYINANLINNENRFSGADDRLLYPGGSANRINSHITNAIVLKNQNIGYGWNFTASVEKPMQDDGLFFKAAYSYGINKNTVDPGSIAFGSWNANPHMGDPNNPGLAFATDAMGHRAIGAISYRTPASTTFTFFYEGFTQGRFSYIFAGDLNRDGGTANDLIYIPYDASEMNFFEFTAAGETFTVEEQQAAWEAYIQQDKYLSANRGQFAERNGAVYPMVHTMDFSISHDLKLNVAGTQNRLQIRMDIFNLTNLINKDWGVGRRTTTSTFLNQSQPLVVRPGAQGGPVDADGRAIYRLQNVGNQLITETFQPTLFTSDLYRIQIGLRYLFN